MKWLLLIEAALVLPWVYIPVKKKALKVLSEIQDAIEDTYYYNIENLGCGSYALKKGCEIYEMPQDEEDF